MATLRSTLNLPEAIGLSMAITSPTVTAAFNITMVVGAAGAAAPLAFAVGMAAMLLVAVAFIAFARRIAHAGSAYAYIAHTFGKRAGFIAGCMLLLTYLGFTTGFGALVGSFTAAALKDMGFAAERWWLAIGAGSMFLAAWLAYRDMRLSGRLMLALEGIAVLGILALCVRILHRTHPGLDQVLASIHPVSAFGGWTGFGFAMVFSILSYGGFEGAATLGEETHNPRRNIPIALFSTVAGCGVFFIFISYCEVVGFAPVGLKALADSQAPLNDLALRYASPRLAIALDLFAAISCFSGALGGISAVGRMLFALGRAGLSRRLAEVHPTLGTPARAVLLASASVIVPYLLLAPFAGAGNYYSYTATIGALALILVYIGVSSAEVVEALRGRKHAWAAACGLATALLLWVLYRNVYPVPDYPNDLWPYFTLAWVVGAWGIMRLRPAVTAPLPELM